jgi:hypothetical protein
VHLIVLLFGLVRRLPAAPLTTQAPVKTGPDDYAHFAACALSANFGARYLREAAVVIERLSSMIQV